MRAQFSLFQSHLDLAQALWARAVKPGDTVVDATLGNGHDALALARLALTASSGHLFAFDIQEEAHKVSQERLSRELDPSLLTKISFHEISHEKIAEVVPAFTARLIVYNLGYLPGEDKSLTTEASSTVSSLKSSLALVLPGGIISITCYPGHEAGLIEEEAVLSFAESLDPKVWNASSHRFVNRRLAPHLVILQKSPS